jgi:hypothetical protein
MRFLTNLLKGILISLIGSIVVYIVVFALVSGKSIKNFNDVKTMVNDMVSVREKMALLNSRLALVAAQAELQSANDEAPPEQKSEIDKTLNLIEQQLKLGEESRNRIETNEEFVPDVNVVVQANEFHGVKKDITRLQKQLDRIENNNRLLLLQIRLLQKQNEQLILQNKSARK